MYRSTTTQIRIGGSGSGFNKRLDSTLSHIKKGGLPVNPKILTLIKQKLKSGEYNENRQDLLNDLMSDPFLFIYTVKKLHELEVENSESILPLKELRILPDQKLLKLFDITESDVSSHRARKTTTAQALRLQHSIISSISAASFAEKHAVSGDEAYVAALLNQLGLNLVSWNYPEQYRQALRIQKSGKALLEEEIERMIGIAPIAISRKLAEEWRLSPIIKRSLIIENSSRNEVTKDATYDKIPPFTLSEICKFSELFAKANDQEHYPNALKDWESSKFTIINFSDKETLSSLQNKIDISLSLHEEVAQFKPSIIIRSNATSKSIARGTQLINNNQYLKECALPTKNSITQVYELIEQDSQVSLNAIKLLAENVLPLNGFSRGSLYLLDEKELQLNPTLRIGDKPLSFYSNYRMHQNNIVTSSIDTVIPIVQRITDIKRDNFCYIAGGLGSLKPQGVLYLEASLDFFEKKEHDILLYFHMARVALMDCLGIPQNIWPDKKSKRALLYNGGL